MKFSPVVSDQYLLSGEWYLYQKIVPNIQGKDSVFPIDSTSYLGEKFTLDIENMLFKSERYPYNGIASKYRMSIHQDTINVKSGAFRDGKPLYKNSYTFMISEDTEHLRIYNTKEKDIEIYHKR